MTLTLEIDLPDELAKFRLPEAVDMHLQSLLDKQDLGQPLSAAERAEAEGLVNLAEFLTLLRLRAEAHRTMTAISARLRAEVVRRAGNRCEYCGLSQTGQEATFHIDHVVPQSGGGPTTGNNLALACVSCSLRKWAHQTAFEPETGEELPLFNPRTQIWGDHFRWEGETIVPLTPTGRATVAALALNRPVIVVIRREEAIRGRHPPA